MKNLIILTEPRSGSELLFWSLAMSINDCYFPTNYTHEILNFKVHLNNNILVKQYLHDIGLDLTIENAKKEAINIQKLYFKCDNICKIYKSYDLEYNHPYWEWLKSQDYIIIHLVRKNTLRRFISIELGKKTGIWHIKNDNQVLNKIYVDIHELNKFLLDAEIATNFFRSYYNNLYEVDYDDMIKDTESTIRNISNDLYLSVDTIRLSCTRMTNPFKTEDIINNYDEVVECLTGGSYEWMCY